MSINLKAHEVEIRVLAALTQISVHTELLAQQAMVDLDENCFSSHDTRKLYEIIRGLFDAKKDFSVTGLLTNLPDHLFGLVTESLREEYKSTHCLANDVIILNDKKILRLHEKILGDLSRFPKAAMNDDDAKDIILDGLNRLHDATRKNKSSRRSYEQIIDEMLTRGEEGQKSTIEIDIPGMPPVPNKALIVIAGRSGHGKTYFSTYFSEKVLEALPEKSALYFNLEMDELQMVERHANILGVRGVTPYKAIEEAAPLLVPKKIWLVSEPLITIEKIEAESRISSMENPISIIVVDYLALVQSNEKDKSNDIVYGNIAKRLTALAIELECVVVLLQQINRSNSDRKPGNKCPVVTDSSATMGAVHSCSWWLGIDQPKEDSSDYEFRNLFQVRCRKNRGKEGTFSIDLNLIDGVFSERVVPFLPIKPKTSDRLF